jgi:hypothetical protein
MRRAHEYSTGLWSGRFPVGAILLAIALCFGLSFLGDALAGTKDHSGPVGPDPILTGVQTRNGPCEKATGVDYAGGSDVYGNPVVPADVPPSSITVGMANDVVIPEVRTHQPNLDGVRVHAAVNGLDKAVQPDPACPPPDAAVPRVTTTSQRR